VIRGEIRPEAGKPAASSARKHHQRKSIRTLVTPDAEMDAYFRSLLA
jgi:hypothetical protein